MTKTRTFAFCCLFLLLLSNGSTIAQDSDPYRWLEDVESAHALAWVESQNAQSTASLTPSSVFQSIRSGLLSVLNSNERIPSLEKIGSYYYNHWTEASRPRGVWRRTTLESYRSANPQWETVLDLDALSAMEKESWVWHGATVLQPESRYCMVALSRGGADADVKREFDLQAKAFVDGGFFLPEAKSEFAWIDQDTAYVMTDSGPGSLSPSGYPIVVKEWKRGTPLEEAPTVYQASQDDMAVSAIHDSTPGFERDFVFRYIDFWTSEVFLLRNGEWIQLDIPNDCLSRIHRDWLFISLRSDWQPGVISYPAGALLAISFEAFLSGDRDFSQVFEPGERTFLSDYQLTKNYLILNMMDNVRTRLAILTLPVEGGTWVSKPLTGMPDQVTAEISAVDRLDSDTFFINLQGFITPPTYGIGDAETGSYELLRAAPALFDTTGLEVTQFEVQSADGTMIPYSVVAPANLPLHGKNVTLLYGYGGFEVPILPAYSMTVGKAWIERGGVYVEANIRGGNEFGPMWHQAAIKENKHKSYEDFIAVAEDLIRRQITSTSYLGIVGGSNGGLLVGNMLTRRPDLFGAILCAVPLLDMQRYHLLLAGASWMAEYGDPENPAEWAYIQTFSPYHNVQADETYPPIFFTTSTRDDRVHPGHARKMVAKMIDQGHPHVLYYENTEGGHAGAADTEQSAFVSALEYSFLWATLQPPANSEAATCLQ
ncbi:MAG: prolyl oligopeptidase family serine peptidase [bacterium]|jgi:prolyl oligopeptidase|nr:prolyl oligopeptidase family serine peptidase [bacterium]